VRDQTPLKKGQITTGALRGEFRKDPRLPILIGDENFMKLVRKGVEEEVYVYRSGDLLLGKGDPFAEIKIDENSFVFTTVWARQQGIWPRKPPEPRPEGTGGGGTGGGSGGTGGGAGGDTGGGGGPERKRDVRTFRAEAPLREALVRIWDQAKQAGVARLSKVSLRVFDLQDAFRLLGVVGRVAGAEKSVEFAGEYETGEGRSSLQIEFRGRPEDAGPVKEFLDAQFRAASEKDLRTRYELSFPEGLDLSGDAPTKLTEQLARFASGAAFVEAEAESAPEGSR
jgi:hypothetical protein